MILRPSSLSRHFDVRSKTPICTTARAAEIPEICRSHKPWGSIHCDLERRCPLKPDPLADPAKNRGSYPRHSGDPSARTPRKTRHTPDSAFGRVRSCSPFNFHKPWDHSLRYHCPAPRGDIGVRVAKNATVRQSTECDLRKHLFRIEGVPFPWLLGFAAHFLKSKTLIGERLDVWDVRGAQASHNRDPHASMRLRHQMGSTEPWERNNAIVNQSIRTMVPTSFCPAMTQWERGGLNHAE